MDLCSFRMFTLAWLGRITTSDGSRLFLPISAPSSSASSLFGSALYRSTDVFWAEAIDLYGGWVVFLLLGLESCIGMEGWRARWVVGRLPSIMRSCVSRRIDDAFTITL